MRGYDDRFTRGVFTCIVCHRNTRGNGDSAQLELCPECYELAGWDNHHNDNGTTPTPDEMAEYCELRDKAVARGGDKDRIEGLNDFLFNEETLAD